MKAHRWAAACPRSLGFFKSVSKVLAARCKSLERSAEERGSYGSVFLLVKPTFSVFSDWPRLEDVLESVSGAVRKIIESVSLPQRRVSWCVYNLLLDVDSGTDSAFFFFFQLYGVGGFPVTPFLSFSFIQEHWSHSEGL